MIYPQSLALREAYDPYLVAERWLYLDGRYESGLFVSEPDLDDFTWVWCMAFDHQNTEVQVCVKHFNTLNGARNCLLWLLWNNGKVLKTGGFSDLMSEEMYQEVASFWRKQGIWGVNS
jgi:hypothetical protein